MKSKAMVIVLWLTLMAPAIVYWMIYDSDGWTGFAVGMYAFLVTMPALERVARSG